MAGCRVGEFIWLILGIFLIVFDFYSDTRVTIGLYNSCHTFFTGISIAFNFSSQFLQHFLMQFAFLFGLISYK